MTRNASTARTILQRAAISAAAVAMIAGGAVATAGSASAAPKPITLTSASCPYSIAKGQTSGCVTRLQDLLNAKQGAKLVADGVFGERTRVAVVTWQKNHKLTADGLVGPATKASLEGKPSTSVQARIVSQAKALAKTPNVRYGLGDGHGAKPGPTSGRIDCSGYTRWVVGKALGHEKFARWDSSADQKRKVVATSRPVAGDLVFFNKPGAAISHVGVYLGSSTMLSAIQYGNVNGIHKDNLSVMNGYQRSFGRVTG
ncbi:C40 family peptidase [Luteipulveratus mongoliensis]|nr:NlpC/P60 family protein [Luteipulveratus mongoliensis]